MYWGMFCEVIQICSCQNLALSGKMQLGGCLPAFPKASKASLPPLIAFRMDVAFEAVELRSAACNVAPIRRTVWFVVYSAFCSSPPGWRHWPQTIEGSRLFLRNRRQAAARVYVRPKPWPCPVLAERCFGPSPPWIFTSRSIRAMVPSASVRVVRAAPRRRPSCTARRRERLFVDFVSYA